MDKTTSVLAAFDANKLPSTEQFNQFISWFTQALIPQLQPNSENGKLSTQGVLLADDLREVLAAYGQLTRNRNADNVLQESIWHLTDSEGGDINVDKASAERDFSALSSALRTVLAVLWSSTTSEGTSLTRDFFSFLRISLADAAEIVENQASKAKEALREIEQEVASGERDALGRNKKRLREEEDPKVQFQHGMDDLKEVGTAVIGAGQSASSTAQDVVDKTKAKTSEVFFEICDRAQSDPAFQNAIKTIFSILKGRISKSVDNIQNIPPEDISLVTLIDDPTTEQHIPKALEGIRTFVDRIAPIGNLLDSLRNCLINILQDDSLASYVKEVIGSLEKHLVEPGYARSDAAERERQQLLDRWSQLSEGNQKWKEEIDRVTREYDSFVAALKTDEDLERLRKAQGKLARDLQAGLIEVGKEVQSGVSDTMKEAESGFGQVLNQATWFWQDVFTTYLPRVMNILKDIPIPRTEYVDNDIEFVLENLDISSFNLHPSHVYIRNITDIDMTTNASSNTHAAIGTLTHIRIQALQLQLSDVSFFYKDKAAPTLAPSEYTGLLGLTLPPQGVSLDLKIRLIPASNSFERARAKRYTTVELVHVGISPDVTVEVKQSNHSIMMAVFKPIVAIRVREALEKALTGWVGSSVEWMDSVLWDMSKRREVFEDAGVSGWAGVVGAIWSEIGRLRKGMQQDGDSRGEVGWRATGTGVIVEQRVEGEGEVKFAMGAEPQILSGQKRGPLGTASEAFSDRVSAALDGTSMDTENVVGGARDLAAGVQGGMETVRDHAKGIVQEGKRKAESFKHTVSKKAKQEKQRPGWQTAAFDL